FFTIEILRLLGGEKSGPNGGAPTVPDTVMLPQTVADVLARRLARLSPEERDILDLGAVEGETFHTDIVEAGTHMPRIALLKRLRTLHQAHQLVVPTDEGHRFAHGLVREVVLREMPIELRREYHRVVADSLTRGYRDRADYAGKVGYHLFEARRFGEALPFLIGAAREARRLFVNDRSLGFCERALEAQTQAAAAGRRAEILRLKCEVLLALGRPEGARAAAAEALNEEQGRG